RYHLVALDAPVPIAEVVKTGTTIVIHDTLDMDERYRVVVADSLPGVRAALMEPLRASDDECAGALALLWPQPRQIGPDDIERCRRVARLVAHAVERIGISDRERRAIRSFQEALLDLDVRSTKVAVGALYSAASETIRVGGDWYTAAAIDDSGRLGVSVGDVAGHGMPAAATMSQLRFALRAAALTATDPMDVLDSLDRYARTVPGAACATAAYVVVDAGANSVSYACAGHPYPLLLHPDGRVQYLTDGRRVPLCIQSLGGRAESGFRELPPGSALVLYSDGLVERAGESLDRGFDRLAAAAADCQCFSTGDLCSTLLVRMVPPGGYTDDVVVVAVRPVGTTTRSFVTTLHATIDEAPPARHELRAWLDAVTVDPATAVNVVLAASEAVNNAIEHGSHLDPERTVSIEAFLHHGKIVVAVTDWGRWTSHTSASRREPSRGRGLTLIHALSDRVATFRSSTGTRVTMEFRT
ncbi:MAG: ATP-binding SpoIIE family protein phosphatase, partial [Acidimicrobiales bacterium]